MKFAIFLGENDKVNGILRAFSEIFMEFCDNNPIEYQRFKRQMIALGAVGYYLSDDDYTKYEKPVVKKIENWIDDKNKVIDIGQILTAFAKLIIGRSKIL